MCSLVVVFFLTFIYHEVRPRNLTEPRLILEYEFVGSDQDVKFDDLLGIRCFTSSLLTRRVVRVPFILSNEFSANSITDVHDGVEKGSPLRTLALPVRNGRQRSNNKKGTWQRRKQRRTTQNRTENKANQSEIG